MVFLRIEPGDPPVGTVVPEHGDPVAFQGWLGLLGVLGEFVDQDVVRVDVAPASVSPSTS
jgi:hypothetical protein